MKLFWLVLAISSTLLATLDLALGVLAGGFDGWPVSKVFQHILLDPLIAIVAWRLYNNHTTSTVSK